MGSTHHYIAKQPDGNAVIAYTEDEHLVWRDLMTAQSDRVRQFACADYLRALQRMAFPTQRIPQCTEVSARLQSLTGWSVTPVPALIDFQRFFTMLRARTFPAACFIRSRADFDYVEEPDIFHELFGHASLLSDPRVAQFSAALGEAARHAQPSEFSWLARLNWFTVEFGLLRTADGYRAYGAGLVSSVSELAYCVSSDVPARKPFDIIDVLRTPYRIDIMQPVYFVLESLDELAELATRDLLGLAREAKTLGLHPPRYLSRAA